MQNLHPDGIVPTLTAVADRILYLPRRYSMSFDVFDHKVPGAFTRWRSATDWRRWR